MARSKKSTKAESLGPEKSITTTPPENAESSKDIPPSTSATMPEQESAADRHLNIEEIPLPFTATVNVALAILRMAPDSPLMEVRPVGTLPLGTPVTITAIHEGCARLRNGLWIKADFLTPDSAKDTP